MTERSVFQTRDLFDYPKWKLMAESRGYLTKEQQRELLNVSGSMFWRARNGGASPEFVVAVLRESPRSAYSDYFTDRGADFDRRPIEIGAAA